MTRLSRRETLVSLTTMAGVLSTARAGASGLGGTIFPNDLRVNHLARPAGPIQARPRFHWTLYASNPASRNLRQTACRVIVADPTGRILFDSGRRDGSEPSLIPGRDMVLPRQTPLDWQVMIWDQDGRASRWSEAARLLTDADLAWRGAWIAAERDGPITAPANEASPATTSAYRLPLLRRGFAIDRPVRHAVVCLSGLGAHALSVNGDEAGATLLNPGWTDYRRIVLYETIDVTRLLRLGDNMLGVRLGCGMYDVASRPGRYTKFVASFGAPKLILQLRIVHDDGSERWIVSDGSWRTRPGPILFSSLYGGEDHDARLETIGWDEPDSADDPVWRPVVATTGPGGDLSPQQTPGLVVTETVRTVRVTHPAAGIALHDLGVNFAGRPRLTVSGAPGAIVRIRPGELLDPSGRVSQSSMGVRPGEAILFCYTLGEEGGTQSWAPRFSYTGFRYLEVEGDGVVALDGEFVRADLPTTGDFLCSDGQCNAIHALIRQAVLSNVATVITDCPTREKLGWLEQTWLNAETIFRCVDAMPLYAKLTEDMLAGQRADGMVPSISPEYIRFVHADGTDTPFRHSPEWGSAIVQAPWAAYRFSGDATILIRAYPAMRRYLDYLNALANDGLLDVGLGDWYDIGPAPPGEAQLTSRGFTASAIWYGDLLAMARIAGLLGRPADAADTTRRADCLKARINARLLDPVAHRYDRDSQTANAMALVLGLVPSEQVGGVLANLLADIKRRGDHVSAGDIGFHYVVRALADAAPDVLAALLARRDPPSYGAQLAQGATALTEAWNADRASSQNHFMLGHALPWLSGRLAGIDLDFARGRNEALLIAPCPVAGITGAAATLRCAPGLVQTRWRTTPRRFHLDIAIPAGAIARVRLPGDNPDAIREGRRALDGRSGVVLPPARHGYTDLRVGSGNYSFTIPIS